MRFDFQSFDYFIEILNYLGLLKLPVFNYFMTYKLIGAHWDFTLNYQQ